MSAKKLCSGKHKHGLCPVCRKSGCLDNKFKLAKSWRLIKVISVTLPKHKVSCCKRRKMAGVLLRETSRTELWRHIPSRQACVMCADRMTSVGVCAFFDSV